MAEVNQNTIVTYSYKERITTTIIVGVDENGTYKFGVLAIDEVGNISYAKEIEIVVSGVSNPPTGLTLNYNSSNKQITLTWADPSDADLDDLLVYGSGGSSDYPSLASPIDTISSGVQQYQSATSLANGTYAYIVRARSTNAKIERNTFVVSQIVPETPAIPAGLVAAPIPLGAVSLDWFRNVPDGYPTPTQYKIYSDNGGVLGTPTNLEDTISAASDSAQSWDSGQLTTQESQEWSFAVSAVYGGEESTKTDSISVTLDGENPLAIEELTAEVVA